MNQIGKIIKSARTERGLSIYALYSGLCGFATGSKIENGTHTPGRLLIQAILGRLRMNAGEFGTLLSYPEYEHYLWRRKVYKALEEGNKKKVRELLSEKEFSYRKRSDNLQEQFSLLIHAIVEEDAGKSEQLIQQAIHKTIPDYQDNFQRNWIVNIQELGMFLLLAEKKYQCGKRSDALRLLEQAEWYIWGWDENESQKARIVSEIARIRTQYAEADEKMPVLILCKEALNLMSENRILYGMEEVLSYLSENTGEREYAMYLAALRAVFQEYGYSPSKQYACLMDINQEVYLIHEVIRAERQRQGISQEKLSEGICESESLSRIETGMRTPTPRHYREIAERLGISTQYYNGRLDTTDYGVLRMREYIGKESSRNNPENAWNYFCELKEKLKESTPKNCQYLESMEASLLYRNGKISIQELMMREEKALRYTIQDSGEKFWKRHFTRTEGEIINHLCIALRELGRTEEAVELLEKLFESYRNSAVEEDDQWAVTMVVRSNLCNYLSDIGRNQEAIEWGNIAISKYLRKNDGRMGGEINNIVFAHERLGDYGEAECKKWYQIGYYLCKLYKLMADGKAVEKYYKLQYGENITDIN